MSKWTLLLLTSAALSAACINRGGALEEPIGRTAATSVAKQPPAEAPSAAAPAPSNDIESYLAGASAGPCGADAPSVEFSGTSTQIDEAQVRALQRLAECLNAAPYDKSSVVLIGYTDVIGTVPANLELGLARAQVVMGHLASAGVAPGRIVVASAGELERPRARLGLRAPRVEILIARGGPPRPNEAPITRGIDTEGLVPPPRQTASPTPTAQPPRPASPQPARKP